MTAVAYRRLATREDLLAASAGDAFVRWELPADQPVLGWAHPEGAVTFVRATPSGRRQLAVLGTPEAALPALRAHLEQGLDGGPDGDGPVGGLVGGLDRGVTVPLGTLDLLGPDPRVGRGDDWEWFWTTTALPEHPDVEVLGPADHDDVAALLAVASPRHSATVHDDVREWVGIRDHDGRLVACAAHTEHVPGVPHLASVATHPDVRGRGLGQAVTGTLTARALRAGAPVVTLGMYSDNAVARRMYARLGFRCDHRWSSRRLVPR
jgi:ribosomal protein S18 acetylase RimI-like enzyme